MPPQPVQQRLLHLRGGHLLPRQLGLRRGEQVAVVLEGERRARDLDPFFCRRDLICSRVSGRAGGRAGGWAGKGVGRREA